MWRLSPVDFSLLFLGKLTILYDFYETFSTTFLSTQGFPRRSSKRAAYRSMRGRHSKDSFSILVIRTFPPGLGDRVTGTFSFLAPKGCVVDKLRSELSSPRRQLVCQCNCFSGKTLATCQHLTIVWQHRLNSLGNIWSHLGHIFVQHDLFRVFHLYFLFRLPAQHFLEHIVNVWRSF